MKLGDGQPIRGDVIGVVDEAAPHAGSGVYYAVAAVRIIDPELVGHDALSVIAGRKRPFHYHQEGVEVRRRMADVIETRGVLCEVLWQPAKRNGQVAARSRLMAEQALRLEDDGIEHLIIESGDLHSNRRDQETLLKLYENEGGVPFAYDWRSKSEPLLWIADTFCGAAAEYLLNIDSPTYERLAAAGLIAVTNLPP